jgi:hypothetical protein
MVIPFDPEYIFEINESCEVVSFEDEVLIVDNWYKNYDKMKNILLNTPVPRWKWVEGGRNFLDYFDCRLSLPVHFPTSKTNEYVGKYATLLNKFYKASDITLTSGLYEFNYYKNLKADVSSLMQHSPHVDFTFNCIIYLDSICSGGTAVYDLEGPFENKEHENLLFDVSKLNKKVIPAKPNRLVIFKGDRYHGGYIQDHNKYLNDWRINQVIFFQSN